MSIECCQAVSTMSDYQVVLVKEAQDLKWGKDADDDKVGEYPLLSASENPLPSTILVFATGTASLISGRKHIKPQKKGVFFEVFQSAPIHENKVPGWIEGFVRDKGYSIQVQASRH